jgi:hypothetical protein
MRPLLALVALVSALALTGCGKDEPAKPPTPTPPSGGGTAGGSSGAIPMPEDEAAPAPTHEHISRHGGRLLELGEHEGHVEVLHDAAAGTLKAWVSDADMEPVDSEAPVVNLTKGVQVPMTPQSGAGPKKDAWIATHDALKGPLDGRLRVKIGDRTYQAPITPP